MDGGQNVCPVLRDRDRPSHIILVGSESGSERSACSSKERVDSFSRLRKEHSKDSAGTVENHTSTPNPHKGCERLTRKDFSGQRWRVSSRDKAVMAIPCKKERKKSMNELMEDLYVLQDRKSAKRTANKKAAERRIVDQVLMGLAIQARLS